MTVFLYLGTYSISSASGDFWSDFNDNLSITGVPGAYVVTKDGTVIINPTIGTNSLSWTEADGNESSFNITFAADGASTPNPTYFPNKNVHVPAFTGTKSDGSIQYYVRGVANTHIVNIVIGGGDVKNPIITYASTSCQYPILLSLPTTIVWVTTYAGADGVDMTQWQVSGYGGYIGPQPNSVSQITVTSFTDTNGQVHTPPDSGVIPTGNAHITISPIAASITTHNTCQTKETFIFSFQFTSSVNGTIIHGPQAVNNPPT
jgi:hypothetical protein